MPRVDDPQHEQLMHDVRNHARACGFTETFELTPATVCDIARMALSRNHSIQATLVRTRADRIFHNPSNGALFKVDGKTSGWTHGQDFPIEALPLTVAIDEWQRYGVKYLFACRRNDRSGEYGLIANESAVPLMQRILLPDWKWDASPHRQEYLDYFKSFMARNNHNCFVGGGNGSGSGDPFAAIHFPDDVPHWADVITVWGK